MTTLRRFIFVLILVAIGAGAWFVYGAVRVYRHIPEAYAAWDAGVLLVEYMRRNEDRWPASWEQLLAVIENEDGERIMLRGASGETFIYGSLPEVITIDWTFDPQRPGTANPVTRANGRPFTVLWQGADPNEMVREHLSGRAAAVPESE